ncbi:MAG TPA: hypothetical protein VHG88_07050 [Burkholderiales bacterium]|nr:hypothetical protein [Burkholderiales bacterium]
MIELYAAGTSNGMRARMALDTGKHKTPQFLAAQMGARPAMQRALNF